jgi:beta-glucosidase
VKFPASAGEPAKRLVAWEKASIAAGDTHHLTFTIDPLYLSIFNTKTDKWEIVPGEYEVFAGPASDALPLHAKVTIGN